MKGKNTLVDFEKTSYTKTTDDEIVARCFCRLQLEKLELNTEEIYKLITKRFKFIDKDGKFEVFGKARCLKEDKFDETLGQHIAETRAQEKAYSIAFRALMDIRRYIHETLITDLNIAIENCNENEIHSYSHAKELIG